VATAFRARKTRARECYKAIRGCFWRWREISQWLKGRGRERGGNERERYLVFNSK